MNSIIINFDNSADINAAFKQLKKQYPTGIRISFEDHLAKRNLTVEDIDRMLEEEDVELEYELPR